MLSDDGQIGLVFNGCIYNFREIRAELEALGHRFRSHTDTEVLLRGYQQWGIDRLVPKLRGMFAFALWDDPEQKLTMVRDRLGVKPLIYCQQNGEHRVRFHHGGTALGRLGGEIDPVAVLDLLEFGFVTDKRSIYAGNFQAAARDHRRMERRQIVQRQYWSVPVSRTLVDYELRRSGRRDRTAAAGSRCNCDWLRTCPSACCSAAASIPAWCAGRCKS